ncbi:hypothetical protein SASPL_133465 [Salvia splendens]|uniref:Uncharacterized protein n=1 Tax=Salvia splendens TaxID=180675 RepID=A0A8X8X5M2_SALSN|nr:hypothetical protein SASPL_133465 [Salvia splendens]
MRKGQIATNTLVVCDRYMRFVYVLQGWEWSAADSRVLRDAINRVHGLLVLKVLLSICKNMLEHDDAMLVPECLCSGGKMSVHCAEQPNKHHCNDSGTTLKPKLL